MSGVYTWIREGVRQAVLLGFSDALEQVGAPPQNEALSQHLSGVLRELPNRPLETTNVALEAPAATTASRKRLGRSLGQTSKSHGPEMD